MIGRAIQLKSVLIIYLIVLVMIIILRIVMIVKVLVMVNMKLMNVEFVLTQKTLVNVIVL
jgi:hypothetical protein